MSKDSPRDTEKKVNPKVDLRLDLADIEGVDPNWQTAHQVRVLVINGKAPVLDQLANWKTTQNGDYKKIMKVMELVARQDRVRNEKHVTSDGAKRGIYEMRADKGHARVLFFYDDDPKKTAICVLNYWKGKKDQHSAFDSAAKLMDIWQQTKPKGFVSQFKKGKGK